VTAPPGLDGRDALDELSAYVDRGSQSNTYSILDRHAASLRQHKET
jgi:hypothetical protein